VAAGARAGAKRPGPDGIAPVGYESSSRSVLSLFGSGPEPEPEPGGVAAVCTAVRIVVAAAERDRRLELRRSVVTAEWEVVGEADGPEAAYQEAVERRARFLVLDASAAGSRPEVIVRRLKSTSPNVFVIAVGDLAQAGADAAVPADGLDALRDTMRDLLHASGDHAHR